MVSNASFEVVTWNQTYKMLLSQAEKITRHFNPEILVGLARGGWIPTRIMSDLLDNPTVASVRIECYTGQSQNKEQVLLTQPVSAKVTDKQVLLVDEVVETGRSLKLAEEHIRSQGAAEIKTATLFYKPWSALKPDFYEKQTKLWIVFPWEIKETVKCMIENNINDLEQIKNQSSKLIKAGAPKNLVLRFIKETLEANR